MGAEWRSWEVRNARLTHIDADLAPPPDPPGDNRSRNWWLVLAIPVIPLVALGVLAWGALTLVGLAGLGTGYVLYKTLPRRGTTRRGLSWAAETLGLRPADED
jgi:hypothetical protein